MSHKISKFTFCCFFLAVHFWFSIQSYQMRLLSILFLHACAQRIEKGIAETLQITIDVLSNTEPNDKKYVFKINMQLDEDSAQSLR